MASIDTFQTRIGLDAFLETFKGLSVSPQVGDELVIEGRFRFTGRARDLDQLEVDYRLRIRVPSTFPVDLPLVEEIGGAIPRDGNHHVNPDGSLCLGSRIRLLLLLSESPTLKGYAERCICPYLFAVTKKLKDGGDFAFGELPHGIAGELLDYSALLGLKDMDSVLLTLSYLATKKKKANKSSCPCGCGKQLGRCAFHKKVARLRRATTRARYRTLFDEYSRWVAGAAQARKKPSVT